MLDDDEVLLQREASCAGVGNIPRAQFGSCNTSRNRSTVLACESAAMAALLTTSVSMAPAAASFSTTTTTAARGRRPGVAVTRKPFVSNGNCNKWRAQWIETRVRVPVKVSVDQAWEMWRDKEQIPQWMPWITSIEVRTTVYPWGCLHPLWRSRRVVLTSRFTKIDVAATLSCSFKYVMV